MKKFIFVFSVLGLFLSNVVSATVVPDTSIAIISPLNGTTHNTNFVELVFSKENATNCWYDLGGLRLSDGVKGDENDPAFQYPLPGCLVTTLDLPNGEYTLNLHSSNEGDSRGLDSSWFVVDKAPEPSQCYVVSDTTNIVENGGYAVQTYDENSSWIEENVLGRLSKWIWDTEQVLNPTSEEIKVFEKKFNISGEIDSALLKAAVDNSYELEINGQTVTVPGMNGEDNFSSVKEVDVKEYLVPGDNTIRFTVKNLAQEGGTYDSNPAGLLYNLELKVYGECSLINSEPQCGEGQYFDSETNSCLDEDPEPELVCNPEINLLKNSGFEEPVVTNTNQWDTFSSGTPDLGWLVEFISGGIGNLELQAGVNGWLPSEGEQYAELDSTVATKIWQDIPTISGETYKLEFDYSGRPSNVDNGIEVYRDGTLLDTLSEDGSANTNTSWITKTYSFTAEDETKIEFKDISSSNSLGGFLDNVRLTCHPSNNQEYDYVTTNSATSITTTSVIVNGTNGDVVAENEAFWYGTTLGGPFVPAVGDASAQYPVGWTGFFAGNQDLSVGGQFNSPISSLTPNTTYYFVAWSLVGGTWYPGDVLEFKTLNQENGLSSQCSDDVDNDGDGFTDMQDTGCTDSEDNDESNEVTPEIDVCSNIEGPQTEVPPGKTLRDGRCITRQSSGSRSSGYSSQSNSEDGRVLGATTTCGIYVDKYLRKGYKNDIEAVKKVQKFLNEYMSAGIIEDGYFGEKTESALKLFQIKHSNNVLVPWDIQTPTGIFYLTTQTEVNNIMCPELKLEKPQTLIPFGQNPLSPKKA